jgi:hypothetical protein
MLKQEFRPFQLDAPRIVFADSTGGTSHLAETALARHSTRIDEGVILCGGAISGDIKHQPLRPSEIPRARGAGNEAVLDLAECRSVAS